MGRCLRVVNFESHSSGSFGCLDLAIRTRACRQPLSRTSLPRTHTPQGKIDWCPHQVQSHLWPNVLSGAHTPTENRGQPAELPGHPVSILRAASRGSVSFHRSIG